MGDVSLLAGKRILVADDAPGVLAICIRALTEAGATVSGYCSGVAALHAADEAGWRADAIVSDIDMPGLTGIALAYALEKLAPGVPVLLMTGDASYAMEVREVGATLLLKPFTGKQLVALVSELVR